jgi:chromosomal replication initiator protein
MSTVEFLPEHLERFELPGSPRPHAWASSVADVQRIVSAHFGIPRAELTARGRHKSVALARHVAMYVCKTRLRCSYPELGRAFGGRDHTTVMSAVRKVTGLRAELGADLAVIEARVS